MEKTLIEQAERYRKQVRRQNEASKKNWDTVSCRLPKGVKDRVRECGESVNGLINLLVLQWLEDHEIKEEPSRSSGIDPEREAGEYNTPEPEPERPFTFPPKAKERTPEEEAAKWQSLQDKVDQKMAINKAELTEEEERNRDRAVSIFGKNEDE